jgi:hypothetical protein
VAIFERKPYAQVETFHPAFLRGFRFRYVREFLRKYEGMVDRERGACTCESDEIETETIDGSGVISGVYVPRRRQREWTIIAPATSAHPTSEKQPRYPPNYPEGACCELRPNDVLRSSPQGSADGIMLSGGKGYLASRPKREARRS